MTIQTTPDNTKHEQTLLPGKMGFPSMAKILISCFVCIKLLWKNKQWASHAKAL